MTGSGKAPYQPSGENTMKTFASALTVCALLFGAMPCLGGADTCRVTYVANEGVLVQTPHHKVLIDALFGGVQGNWCEQPSQSVLRAMIDGVAPFDGVTAVLITHKHADHFSEPVVMEFLKSHPQALLVCPDQVNAILANDPGYPDISARVHSLKVTKTFDTLLTFGGLKIRAMRFDHGPYVVKDSATGQARNIHRDVENICYLVDSDGFTVFHSGDCSTAVAQFAGYGLAARKTDFVLVDRTFMEKEGLDALGRAFDTQNLVFMHVEPGKGAYYRELVRSVPEMSVFGEPLEARTVTR